MFKIREVSNFCIRINFLMFSLHSDYDINELIMMQKLKPRTMGPNLTKNWTCGQCKCFEKRRGTTWRKGLDVQTGF